MPNLIQSISYNQAPEALRREIAVLQHRAEPGASPMAVGAATFEHHAALDALSFYSSADGAMVSYAAVVCKAIRHGGQTFNIAGLSSVATDPDYRRRGFGLRTVAAATRWIAQSNTDLGLFTCDPPLAYFYARAGDWPVLPDVVLIGSRDEHALCSMSLNKVVLMRLFSAKARAFASMLRHTSIDLDLPVGQFL